MTRPIEIIAELGVNWNGNFSNAENMIRIAAEAGADVAKFQLYDPSKRPDIDKHPHKDILLKCKLTKRMLYDLKEICDKSNIEFMCSVFDVDKVDWLEQIGVKRYKIGSKSFYDDALRERILQTEKPMLLSFGYFDKNKVNPWSYFDNIQYLYCISKYPCDFKDMIDLRHNLFNIAFDGLSSHLPGISDAAIAMSQGASIIEKHFTIDRTQQGPDHLFSLDPDELRQLCKLRDDIEKILYL